MRSFYFMAGDLVGAHGLDLALTSSHLLFPAFWVEKEQTVCFPVYVRVMAWGLALGPGPFWCRGGKNAETRVLEVS